MMYDLIIIGSGPAGLSSAVYAQRAMLKNAVIEKNYTSGGQVVNTYEVDNYLGFSKIDGYELSIAFRKHAESLGTEFIKAEVEKIEDKSDFKEITLKNKDSIKTKSVIISTGAEHKKLGIKGEDEFVGKGVSYCATCDGAFFRNKTVAVVGGGDVALEDAIFLSRMCKKVYLIHRRDTLKGAKILQDNLSKLENVELLYNTVVEEASGGDVLTKITTKNSDGSKINLDVDGLFIAIGIKPTSEKFKDLVKLDKDGYIIADENGVTSIDGIFAAGDVRTKQLRQIITSTADGANCVYSAEKYINKIKTKI